MAEEFQGLHIDTDWKKQAQEEKRKLAEEQAKRAAAEQPAAAPSPAAASTTTAERTAAGAAASRTKGDERELPSASIGTLVNSLLTQTLLYLGEVSMRGSGRMIDLDMARHNIDLLGVLEDKTKNNLTPEEQQLLDTALYEARMRFVSVASQYIS